MIDTTVVYTWLKTKARQGKCPACNARFFYEDEPATKTVRAGTTQHTVSTLLPNFDIEGELITMPLKGTRFDGTPARIEFVAVRCNKCGYVMTFDARTLGLVK